MFIFFLTQQSLNERTCDDPGVLLGAEDASEHNTVKVCFFGV